MTLLCCLANTFVPSSSIEAQTQTTGSLSGRVYDAGTPAKKGVADVRMVLRDQETGMRRAVLTGDHGEYYFDLLMPSRYELSCQPDGYENLSGTQPNIQVFIATRRELRVPPFELRRIRSRLPLPVAQPAVFSWPPLWGPRLHPVAHRELFGQAWMNATYPSPASLPSRQAPQTPPGRPASSPLSSPGEGESRSLKLVDTLSATRGGSFTELDLLSLPLQGIRSFDALALLLPGVVQPPRTVSATTGPGIGPGLGTAGQFSVNGLRSRGNNFTVDGSDNNDEDIGVRRQGFTSLVPQSIESVKQFQIVSDPGREPQNLAHLEDHTFSYGGIGFGTKDGEEFRAARVTIVPLRSGVY